MKTTIFKDLETKQILAEIKDDPDAQSKLRFYIYGPNQELLYSCGGFDSMKHTMEPFFAAARAYIRGYEHRRISISTQEVS